MLNIVWGESKVQCVKSLVQSIKHRQEAPDLGQGDTYDYYFTTFSTPEKLGKRES